MHNKPAFYYYSLPLAVWLVLSGCYFLHPHAVYAVYPIQAFVVGIALVRYGPLLPSLRPASLFQSSFIGIAYYLIWTLLAPQWHSPLLASGYDPYPLFGPGDISLGLVVFRMIGGVFIFPIAWELFWRGFLMRRLIHRDFQEVPWNHFAPVAFSVATVLGSFCYGGHWPTACVTGLLTGWWLIRRNHFGDALAAHIIGQALVALHVVTQSAWHLW